MAVGCEMWCQAESAMGAGALFTLFTEGEGSADEMPTE